MLSGARELVAIEQELARARAGDGRAAPTTRRRSTATPRRRRGSSTPAATAGASGRCRPCTGSASATTPTSTARCETFSGGELTRASLGRALAGEPDLLLLDEPTNHLDIASLEWLEQHLVALDAAIVLVAHDRWFLEAVGTSVLELEAGPRQVLPRPVARVAQGEGRARAGPRPRDRAPAGRDRAARAVRDPVPRRHPRPAGAVARQEARPRSTASVARPGRRGGARVRVQAARAQRPRRVRARATATSTIGDKPLLDDAELWLERGEHVSLVGPNGAGKTTLIETLGRAMRGAGRRAGKLRTGHNVKIGYLSQHADELVGGHRAHRARGRPARSPG